MQLGVQIKCLNCAMESQQRNRSTEILRRSQESLDVNFSLESDGDACSASAWPELIGSYILGRFTFALTRVDLTQASNVTRRLLGTDFAARYYLKRFPGR